MRILLGSRSPRRQELLKAMELEFKVVNIHCDESFDSMKPETVAEYLAVKKSDAYGELGEDELLITADTTVVLDKEVLNKPANRTEAIDMLLKLSGNTHKVISGVCLRNADKKLSFHEITEVSFASLSSDEIEHYVDVYAPYDKAGSYGIQEWIGLCRITSVNGCYYNVMGLPCARLYDELKKLY